MGHGQGPGELHPDAQDVLEATDGELTLRLTATVRAQDFDPHEVAQLDDAAVKVRAAMAEK